MKQLFQWVIVLQVSLSSALSQTTNIKKYLKIVQSGLCETDSKSCLRKVSNYFAACESVGDYYCNKHEYRKAIEYYTKVAEINMDGHGFLDLGIIEPRALVSYRNIIRKLGDISFDGLGGNKSIEDAFDYYAILTSPFSQKELSQFSFKIFGDSTGIIFDKSESNDSVRVFYINPFFILDTTTAFSLDTLIHEFDNRLTENGQLKCLVDISVLRMSEMGQAVSFRFTDWLLARTRLKSKYEVNIDFDRTIQYDRYGINYYVLQVSLRH